MAKKPKAEIAARLDTTKLVGDAANPRKIDDKAAKGLSSSLEKFGDLSGIVWNESTGELVCGHQRMQQIRSRWGERPIELIDAANRLYGIRIDADHFFAVRVVRWSKAMQRAANVAANSQAIAGEFTDELTAYLLECRDALATESPGLMDDVLLAELIEVEIAADDSGAASSLKIAESYQIVVQCVDEADQRRLYDKFQGEGLSCKVLTL